MSGASAWIMQINRLSHVAVGQMELVHIVAEPEYVEVPKAPLHCNRVIVWSNKIIPVLNLSILKQTSESGRLNSAPVAVAMYKDATTHELKYGGIQLVDMPVLESVTNDQAVPRFEVEDNIWKKLSSSCFKTQDGVQIPILNLKKLFSPGVDKLVYQ